MIAVLQRVRSAAVSVDGEVRGRCARGLLILLGVDVNDTEEDARLLSEKIANLRIFEDENGKMNLSALAVGGEALVISNFTLLANYSHGHRPDYLRAARPEQAEPLYLHFAELLRTRLPSVECGVFGADMKVDIAADGPVTIVMDSTVLRKGRAK